MKSSPKSAMIAGVLGILLGAFGVHDWYLDRQKKAGAHIMLAIVGAILIAASVILRTLMASATKMSTANIMGNIATTANVLAWLALGADIIWGIIEGIVILAQGDDGLIVQGYTIVQSKKDDDDEEDTSPSMIASQTPYQGNQPMYGPNGQPLMNGQFMYGPDGRLLYDANSQPVYAQPGQVTYNANGQPIQATPAQPGAVTLPPAPTLAEQAANANNPAQPIVFKSSDIQQNTQAGMVNQSLGTKDVQAPALMTTKDNGQAAINPEVKRRVIVGVVVVAAVLIIGLILKGTFDGILADGYGASYRVAKDMMPKISSANESSSCQYALDYAKSAYVDRKTYNGYVDTCKDLVTGVSDSITALGDTPGVNWNGEISKQFKTFKQVYEETFPEGTGESLANTLQLYQTWHEFVLATDVLTVESEDAEFQQAADLLRASGNTTLAKYGEEWLQKQLDYIHAYRSYQETSYTDAEKDALRNAVEERRSELRNWVEDHRPDVTSLEKMYVPDIKPMYESFSKLYDTIKTAYENHYDYESNDCRNLGGKVYCS